MIDIPVNIPNPEIRIPHVQSKRIVDYYGNGKMYEMSIFSGDGKKYDALAAHDPLMPQRVGSILLRLHPVCPILEQITEHTRGVTGTYERAVEIRVPHLALPTEPIPLVEQSLVQNVPHVLQTA